MSEKHLCGAPTKRGKPCCKPVRREGDRCVWHTEKGVPPRAPIWLKRAIDSFYPIENVANGVLVKARFVPEYVEPVVPLNRDLHGTSAVLLMADGKTQVEIDFGRSCAEPLRPRLRRAGPVSGRLPEGCFLRVFEGGDWCPIFSSSLTQTALALHSWFLGLSLTPVPPAQIPRSLPAEVAGVPGDRLEAERTTVGPGTAQHAPGYPAAP